MEEMMNRMLQLAVVIGELGFISCTQESPMESGFEQVVIQGYIQNGLGVFSAFASDSLLFKAYPE
jgi:hypothetical protein